MSQLLRRTGLRWSAAVALSLLLGCSSTSAPDVAANASTSAVAEVSTVAEGSPAAEVSPAAELAEPTPTEEPAATPMPTSTPIHEPVTSEDFEAIYLSLLSIRTDALVAGDVDLLAEAVVSGSQLFEGGVDAINGEAGLVEIVTEEVRLFDRPTDDRVLLRAKQVVRTETGEETAVSTLVTLNRRDTQWRIVSQQRFARGFGLPEGDLPRQRGRTPRKTYLGGQDMYSWTDDDDRRCLELDYGELGRYVRCVDVPQPGDPDRGSFIEVHDNDGRVVSYLFTFVFGVPERHGRLIFELEMADGSEAVIYEQGVAFDAYAAAWGPIPNRDIVEMALRGLESTLVWREPFRPVDGETSDAETPVPPTTPPVDGVLPGCADASAFRANMLDYTASLAVLFDDLPRDLWLCPPSDEVQASLSCYEEITEQFIDVLRTRQPENAAQFAAIGYVFCQAGDPSWLPAVDDE